MRKPYPKYKSSPILWLPQIPEGWDDVKIKFLFKERIEKGFENEPLLAATQTQGVVPKELYENRTVTAQKDFHLLKLVKVGDFVVSLRSFQGGIEYAHYQGIISPAYTIMKPSKEVAGRFYRYLFKSKNFVDDLATYVTGIREGQNIDYGAFRESFQPLPPLSEQIQIANFLDYKCTLIDTAIQKKTRLIELLKEQKQAVINRAVTRGLYLDAPMKDSGIEWLGVVPVNWEIKKAKWIFKEIDIRSVEGKEELLSVSHYDGVRPRKEKDVYMFMAESYEGHKLCSPGDLVINIMWAWMGALGVSQFQGIVSSGYCVYRQKNDNIFNWDYLEYMVRLKPYIAEYTKKSKGIHSSRWRMYTDDFYQIHFIIPPREEQDQIIDFLNHEISTINTTILRIEREIELIKEYKTTLIAEAVTGKIDVRDWKPKSKTTNQVENVANL